MRSILALTAAALALAPAAQARYGPSNEQVIRQVFGTYGSQAIRVGRCESGLNVYARNGQYLGIWQMGEWARGRYGHSYTVRGQAQAAYRYFRDNGYSWWGAWSCAWAAY